MSRYQRWLELLRSEQPTGKDAAEASLARIMTTLDQRARGSLRARRVARGVLGVAACALVAQQLSPVARKLQSPVAVMERQRPAHERPAPAERLAPTPTGGDARSVHGPAAPIPTLDADAATSPARRARGAAGPRASASRARAPIEPSTSAPVGVQGAPEVSRREAAPLSEASLRGLYETAHRLQYSGTPAAALSAWDLYLAAAPSGPLSVEARYYRALTLLRLGRASQARAALVPFAHGEYGEFRRLDAARWLDQLDAGAMAP